MWHILSEFAHEHEYCFNGEITAQAHPAYSALHRLLVYFRNKIRNMEAHSWPKKILIVHYSTKNIDPTISKSCITQNRELNNNGNSSRIPKI